MSAHDSSMTTTATNLLTNVMVQIAMVVMVVIAVVASVRYAYHIGYNRGFTASESRLDPHLANGEGSDRGEVLHPHEEAIIGGKRHRKRASRARRRR